MPDPVPEHSKLTRAEAIQVLGYYLSMAPPRWQNQNSFLGVFISADLTVLGATLIGLSKFSSWPKNLILLVAPVSALVIAELAKKILKGQERHVRELMVVIAHLEDFIGLRDAINRPANSDLWPKDTYILPTRWVKSRLTHESSDAFINDRKSGGTVRASVLMFIWLQIVALVVIAIVLALPVIAK
jgi:hypothetical protein